MPSATNSLPKWQRPQKTTQELPWADIKVLDMSKFDKPGGKQVLAEELREAVCVITVGLLSWLFTDSFRWCRSIRPGSSV